MLSRFLLAVAVVVGLLGSAAKAEAQAIEGNPFVEPIPLAGTWRYIDRDLSPAEAATADIMTWHSMEVPGRRSGERFDPAGWYGIDVRLPPRTDWPVPTPNLAVAPPMFFAAYEVYFGTHLVGRSGSMPPAPRWGPFRQRLFAVPQDAMPQDGRLKVRIRVWEAPSPPIRGTMYLCEAGPLALGKKTVVAAVVELQNERNSRVPWMGWKVYLAPFLLGLAFVFVCLGVFVRGSRAFGWLALLVLSYATMHIVAGRVLSSDDPQRIIAIAHVPMATQLLGLVLFVREVLQLRSRLAAGLTWAALGLLVIKLLPIFVATAHAPVMVLTHLFWLVLVIYLLAVSLRKVRSGQPGARLLAFGLGLALSASVASSAVAVVGGQTGMSKNMMATVEGLSDAGVLGLAVLMSMVVARRYARSLRDLQASFAASRRFVPERFLSLLGRSEITEVKRADATEQKMAIVFADIRGFTTRSEAAGAEATFALVNRYLEAIEPAIHEHGGFINKFLGDGILALFPDAASGLASARALQQAVAELNEQLEKEREEPIRVGVGLHVGTVMLGTVGGKRQLDTSVIADAVNTASRVESLTKRYGVDILATSTALEEAGSTEATRELDRVVVVGRQEPVTLHEVYWQQQNRRDRDSAYADALEAYRQGELEEAHAGFEALAETDSAARRMVAETKQLIERGLPSAWDGVAHLDEK